MKKRNKTVAKTWGMEIWYVNRDYCGKHLIFAEDHRCSMHEHKTKHETFVVTHGRFLIEYKDSVFDATNRWLFLEVGDSFIVRPGLYHRMTAVGGNAALMEFSSHHEDTDSYRIESGQVWEEKG